ncbi:hypothetical protein BJ546DRAFT_1050640 [Cryomyces antarcticus]
MPSRTRLSHSFRGRGITRWVCQFAKSFGPSWSTRPTHRRTGRWTPPLISNEPGLCVFSTAGVRAGVVPAAWSSCTSSTSPPGARSLAVVRECEGSARAVVVHDARVVNSMPDAPALLELGRVVGGDGDAHAAVDAARASFGTDALGEMAGVCEGAVTAAVVSALGDGVLCSSCFRGVLPRPSRGRATTGGCLSRVFRASRRTLREVVEGSYSSTLPEVGSSSQTRRT